MSFFSHKKCISNAHLWEKKDNAKLSNVYKHKWLVTMFTNKDFYEWFQLCLLFNPFPKWFVYFWMTFCKNSIRISCQIIFVNKNWPQSCPSPFKCWSIFQAIKLGREKTTFSTHHYYCEHANQSRVNRDIQCIYRYICTLIFCENIYDFDMWKRCADHTALLTSWDRRVWKIWSINFMLAVCLEGGGGITHLKIAFKIVITKRWAHFSRH